MTCMKLLTLGKHLVWWAPCCSSFSGFCVVFLFYLSSFCGLCPILPVSLDCQFLIAHSGFSLLWLKQNWKQEAILWYTTHDTKWTWKLRKNYWCFPWIPILPLIHCTFCSVYSLCSFPFLKSIFMLRSLIPRRKIAYNILQNTYKTLQYYWAAVVCTFDYAHPLPIKPDARSR
jgi:hypothetical protein